MPETFTDEYGNVYRNPYISSKIVGFSGIDPMPVTSGGVAVVNPTGYTPPDVGSTGSSTADHEELDGLLGGNEDGHYHLSSEEYDVVQEILSERADADDEERYTLSEDEYNGLTELLENAQASDDDEDRYTLNEEEYNRLTELLNTVYPDGESEPVFNASMDEEALTELIDARIAEYMSQQNNCG